MKNAFLKLVSGVFILAFISCAPVRFYSNAEMTKKSGLKYYTVKPYLQVDRDPSNNCIVKATIIYLPDLENPQYIVMRDGLGARKLDLKLDQGSINTLGLDTDPKIAETLTALSNLVSKTTSAITDIVKPKSLLPSASSTAVTELYDIIMADGLTSVKRIEIR